MTHNCYIRCPVCKSVTRLRIPVGYVSNIPIRFLCGECDTLLAGRFLINQSAITFSIQMETGEEVPPTEYRFYGEVAGELVCAKIVEERDGIPNAPSPNFFLTPIMRWMPRMNHEEMNRFIDFACHISDISDRWNQERILFDLFRHRQYDRIRDAFQSAAREEGCALDTLTDITRYVHRKYLYHFGGLFSEAELWRGLRKMNDEMNGMDRSAVAGYTRELEKQGRFEGIREKMFDCMDDFVKIAPFLIPAVGVLRCLTPESIDREEEGISTCTFNDIKSFYQDTYEDLAGCCDLAAGLDNILYRGDFGKFDGLSGMEEFLRQSKGNRIKRLNPDELFSGMLGLRGDENELRNAIGHKTYKYEGISQRIRYWKREGAPQQTAYLLDVAIQCVELMRSSMVVVFLLYKLSELSAVRRGEACLLHPRFYRGADGGSRCPCGSGKKYRQCCKSGIKAERKRLNSPHLPARAETEMDMESFLKLFSHS